MKVYCLDSNVLIEAWNKYYSHEFCPDYWDVLSRLGNEGKIYVPENVRQEIMKKSDGLSNWLKANKKIVRPVTDSVQQNLKKVFADPAHHKLVDNTKNRSQADPWVIAHAMSDDAIVVTKEYTTPENSHKVKIPDVCNNLGVAWIDDFQMVMELGIKFSCRL